MPSSKRSFRRRSRRTLSIEPLEARLMLDSTVVFNELLYHPADNNHALEWIELHNQLGVDIDLSGWSIDAGIEFDFPEGTIIPGKGHIVVAASPSELAAATGFDDALGPFDGRLANGGERIELIDNNGRVMDTVEYDDDGDWPVGPDGSGSTLAKWNPDAASGSAANWQTSTLVGGTPGAENFPEYRGPVQSTPVGLHDTWRYDDAGIDRGDAWRASGFDDAAWPAAMPLFGSGEDLSGGGNLTVTDDLVVRYKAQEIAGVANGATPTVWTDSATGDGLTQNAAAGGNPTYREDVIAGNAVVRFDGSVDEMRMSSSPGIGGGDSFTYFLVVKANQGLDNGGISDGNGDYILDRNTSAPNAGNPLVSLKAVGGRYGYQTRYDDGSGLGGPVSTTPISTTDFQIVTLRRNKADGRFELWVDGVLESTMSDNGRSLTPQPLNVGRHATSTTGGFKGDIAEVLVYRDRLSDEDFQAVGAYLESEYGLDTEFDGSQVRTPLEQTAATCYFRTEFQYTGDPALTELKINAIVDDGAVFYLNGVEVHRHNMPGGTIAYATAALTEVAEPIPTGAIPIDAASLVVGRNVLAVEIHHAAASTDSLFGVELTATEYPAEAVSLEINELPADSNADFWIELQNTGETALDIGGYVISTSADPGLEYVMPVRTLASGELLVVTESELGFDADRGDAIFIHGPGKTSVKAAQVVDDVLRGRSAAHDGRWLFPSDATPGLANSFAFCEAVVINEIMYHPSAAGDSSAANETESEWVELFNRGPAPVDLTGWQIDGGIRFEFPEATSIGVGEYLVVAKDAASLAADYPTADIVGNYSGKLSNSGEAIFLIDPNGNPADEVRYYDAAPWPAAADGGGSSLELRDPDADNSVAESWAASDETDRSDWQTYTYRGIAQSSAVGPDGRWQEFILGLLDAGEVLLDDIHVIENPDGAATELIQNGSFESDVVGAAPDKWRLIGTHGGHGLSEIVVDPDDPGNQALHLVATGATEHMHNHAETTLAGGRSIVNGREYEISFRAKWLTGSNQLNTRLYFNRLAETTLLSVPDETGTPGAANSTFEANIGPTFSDASHWPVVPEPGETITVSVTGNDPDGVAAMTLWWAVDGGPWQSGPMTSGTDSRFSGTIPGQNAAAVIQFYIEGEDGLGAVSTFPAAGPSSRALIQVDDGLAVLDDVHNFRIIMTDADADFLHEPTNVMSNNRMGATIVYDEREIFYDAGVRLRSSQRGRLTDYRVGFTVKFPADNIFHGVHKTVSIDRSGATSGDPYEMLVQQVLNQADDIPSSYCDIIHVNAPKSQHNTFAMLKLARYGDVFLDSQYDNGSDGQAFKMELVYYPTTTTDGNPESLKMPQPDSVVGTDFRDLGDDKEAYRWTFMIENHRDLDDYSKLIEFCKTMGLTGAAFEEAIPEAMDVDQWLRAFAVASLFGVTDAYSLGNHHNLQIYFPPEGEQAIALPWDWDFAFVRSTTSPLWGGSNLGKVVAIPEYKRLTYGHLHDIVTTTYNADYMAYWTDHYAELARTDYSSRLNYITARASYVLSQLPAEIPFEITTNGGADFTIDDAAATLSGNGWINVRTIQLAGAAEPLDVVWTDQDSWQVTLGLELGENPFTLQAYDFQGNLIDELAITITSTAAGVSPADYLRIAEIHYNPVGPSDEERAAGFTNNDDFEFIELINTSPDQPIYLSGTHFSDGIDYRFVFNPFQSTTPIDAGFNADSEGFAYLDDAFNGTNNPAFADGQFDLCGTDRAVRFNGVGGHVTAPVDDLNGGDGSVVFWMKPDTVSGSRVPITLTNAANSTQGVTLLTSGTALKVGVGDTPFTTVPGLTLVAGETYMVGVTWTDVSGTGAYEVFVNGQSALTGSWNGMDDISTLYVGKHPVGLAYSGILDEVALFDRPLSGAEAALLYQNGTQNANYAEALTALGPLHYWQFAELAGPTADDAIGNADGTYIGVDPGDFAQPALWSNGAIHVGLTPAPGGEPTSGAWTETFDIPQAMSVDIALRYEMTTGSGFIGTEYAEMLVEVDGRRLGLGGADSIIRIEDASFETGWVDVVLTTSLDAGQHTLSIGAYSGETNGPGDTVDLWIDDVTVSAVSSASVLAPGQRGLLVKDAAAFAMRYGADIKTLGAFTGSLSNDGENITLLDVNKRVIQQFAYDDADAWPGRADGLGSSLEIVDLDAAYADPDNWQSSSEYGGSPGVVGLGPDNRIVINEVLTNTDAISAGPVDAIELYNTTDEPIDIGGWRLSDSSNNLAKFRIPDGTTIPARGYIVFDESDFNPSAGVDPDDFALDGAHGDDVWLMQTDANDRLARFVDHVEFGAAPDGESLGRWPNGRGALYPMTSPTLDAASGYENAGPRVGPIVISEVHHNSGESGDSDDLEFVEIHNPTSQPIDLTDWRIRGSVDYDFDDAQMLGPGQSLVILSFDPARPENAGRTADFRTAHAIDAGVALVGGYNGTLSNTDNKVELQRPDSPPLDDPNFIPHVIEDQVVYNADATWPESIPGESFNRVWTDRWGNDSLHWTQAAPTPGSFAFDVALVGDVNGDNVVSDADLNLVLSGLGATGAALPIDIDGDGDADSGDLRLVLRNFGAVASETITAQAAVNPALDNTGIGTNEPNNLIAAPVTTPIPAIVGPTSPGSNNGLVPTIDDHENDNAIGGLIVFGEANVSDWQPTVSSPQTPAPFAARSAQNSPRHDFAAQRRNHIHARARAVEHQRLVDRFFAECRISPLSADAPDADDFPPTQTPRPDAVDQILSAPAHRT